MSLVFSILTTKISFSVASKVLRSTELVSHLIKEIIPTGMDAASWGFHSTLAKMTPGSRTSEGLYFFLKKKLLYFCCDLK